MQENSCLCKMIQVNAKKIMLIQDDSCSCKIVQVCARQFKSVQDISSLYKIIHVYSRKFKRILNPKYVKNTSSCSLKNIQTETS